MGNWFPLISSLFGWIYTSAWSISFYPQPLLNYRRRSTSGSSLDFPLLNTIGFFMYLLSNSLLYYSPTIRDQYAARNHGFSPTVRFNDLVFAFHAMILSGITVSQYILPKYWGFSRSNPAALFMLRLNRLSVYGLFLSVAIVGYTVFRVALFPTPASPFSQVTLAVGTASVSSSEWNSLDIVYAMGYVKLLVSLIKYIPQLILNYRLKSTEGWSIEQILLDFTGGALSVGQQMLDSYDQHDWSGISGNPVKFALGNLAMLYDLLFFTQHYILYRKKRQDGPPPVSDGNEASPLLA